MKLNEYQQEARKTAIYPKKYSIMYPALGLAGEAGETCEKVKKLIRDDNFDLEYFCSGIIDEELPEEWYNKRDEIEKEIGDLMWYIANLADDFGLKLENIAQKNIDKLKSRQERNKLKGSGDNR